MGTAITRPKSLAAWGTLLAMALAGGGNVAARQKKSLRILTDEVATESTAPWYIRAEQFTVSNDAKVGKYSLTGRFKFTAYVGISRGSGRTWDLSRYEKLRFWAKCDRENKNLLVMLATKGWKNRRDAVCELTTEWKRFELPLDEKTFYKNVQGDASFTRVASIIFYQNSGFACRIWLDGLEFVGRRPSAAAEAPIYTPAAGATKKTVTLSATDPNPHLAQAEKDRYAEKPFYDLPPLGFNRNNSFTDAVIDFDRVRDWQATVYDGDAVFCLSKDQVLRGVPNVKLEITSTHEKRLPVVLLRPPKPVAIDRDFDIVECWAYGFHHGGTIKFHMRRKDGSPLTVGTNYGESGDTVNPQPVGQYWNLIRIVLPEQIEAGAELTAIQVAPKRPKSYRHSTFLFHFDQFRVLLLSNYLKRPAPKFENTGPIVDNFPVDPDGACPRTVGRVKTEIKRVGRADHLIYSTPDGREVRYVYTPKTGTLSDLVVEPKGQTPFQPALGSGPIFDFDGTPYNAVEADGGRSQLVSHRIDGRTVVAEWKYGNAAGSQTIRYRLSLKGKTLRIEASSKERHLRAWRFGRAKGVRDARVIEVPFMSYSPNVLRTDGLFVTYYPDWYVSNVSQIPTRGQNRIEGDTAGYSWDDRPGRSYRYLPRTDGKRYPFRETFYITVSSNFDDVMLTVSNPPSPMKPIMKKRLYRMVLANVPGIFGRARAFVDLCDRYGMNDYYFLFHAPLFFKRRAGCEAFPGDMNVSLVHAGEGGDKGLQELFAYMRSKGVVPGYYDGFPSRDVYGANFHYDWVSLLPNGGWKFGWRAPILKPWAFPELANTLCKRRAAKFGIGVSYQDGITSWDLSYMNDFDHRYPDSGTFRGTMRALATGWQRVRENVKGPVFSEGRGSDYRTAGLNDGDYGKLPGYWDEKDCTEDRVPLLVDFRLKKLGTLWAPVGLNISYAGFAGTNKIHYESYYAKKENYRYLHHYLASEMAFAAVPILEPYWPIWPDPKLNFDQTMRCYFLMRQLMERYMLEPVDDIAYFDGDKFLDTSDALRADVVKDNFVRIRYKNGLTLYINVNWDGRSWTVRDGGRVYELPAGGWLARQGRDFLEFSATIDGHRVDYVNSPAYIYLDGHGKQVDVDGHRTDRQWIRWKTGPKAGETISYP